MTKQQCPDKLLGLTILILIAALLIWFGLPVPFAPDT